MAGIQEGTVLTFGTGAATTYGLVQSFSLNTVTKRAEAMGAQGSVASIQEYDIQEELSMNYLAITPGSAAPAVGTVFQHPVTTGDKYVITSANETETVDGFKSVDISAVRYVDNTLPA